MSIQVSDITPQPLLTSLQNNRGLPNLCYTDPEYHRLEAERLFARNWVCAGAGAEIPRPGDIKPVRIANQPILLVRNGQGAIRAFHNVCRHRGVQLATEPQSRGAVIRCPYHSWTYSLDGKLVRTPMVGGPGIDSCPDLNTGELGLRTAPVSVWNDLIFVNLSGQGPSLDDVVAPLNQRWSKYDFSNLRHAASWSLELQANWKLVVENYLESYHLPWIHPDLNDRSPLEHHSHFVASDWHFGQITDQFGASELSENPFRPFPGLGPTEEQCGEYPIFFPNVLLGLQRDHFYGIIIEPLANDRTREYVHLYMVGPEPDQDREQYRRAMDKLVENWKLVFTEDVWVVERMQMGRAADAFDGGVLTARHDDLTRRFMRGVADQLQI